MNRDWGKLRAAVVDRLVPQRLGLCLGAGASSGRAGYDRDFASEDCAAVDHESLIGAARTTVGRAFSSLESSAPAPRVNFPPIRFALPRQCTASFYSEINAFAMGFSPTPAMPRRSLVGGAAVAVRCLRRRARVPPCPLDWFPAAKIRSHLTPSLRAVDPVLCASD